MAKNKWTVMFFFASDNALSPVVVSQLKAIKEAGFQEDTEVLVYFDPGERGVPTKIYNVNRERKRRRQEKSATNPSLSKNIIGDGEDPFVHNLEEDDVITVIDRSKPVAAKVDEALKRPDELTAKEALSLFLEFCRENHRAEHYILFLVGHGIIVGNDAFLPDENPVSSITLKELGVVLQSFGGAVEKDNDTFELLALHSCSMSAIEVAYEVRTTADKRTAKLMMASEGISYVNSWPHRQLLKKLFKTIDRARQETDSTDIDVPLLMRKLFFLSFFNAKDFNLSGYPLDVALCNLENEDNFTSLSENIKKLVKQLSASLNDSDERGKELILLAHLEAQSYWGETYTDILDFCRCLSVKCDRKGELPELSAACKDVIAGLRSRKLEPAELAQKESGLTEKLRRIESAAEREQFEKDERERWEREARFKGLVIFSRTFGTAYQYSHGLSVYFPWAPPVENVGNGTTTSKARKAKGADIRKVLDDCTDDKVKALLNSKDGKAKELLETFLCGDVGILERYEDYAFTTELQTESEDNSWLSFLRLYLDKTRREKTRLDEDNPEKAKAMRARAASSASLPGGTVPGGIPGIVPTSIALEPPQKDSPSSGIACICTTVKNYPLALDTATVPPNDIGDEAYGA
jgi:hypothetical protein